jgi:hypothetical protein
MQQNVRVYTIARVAPTLQVRRMQCFSSYKELKRKTLTLLTYSIQQSPS